MLRVEVYENGKFYLVSFRIKMGNSKGYFGAKMNAIVLLVVTTLACGSRMVVNGAVNYGVSYNVYGKQRTR